MKKLSLILLGGLLAACSSTPQAPKASLDGEVYYLQRIALPPAATLSVSLQDVSLMDAPAVTLASQNGPVKGNVPLPFHLSYDPAQVKPGHRYAVSARIELDGKLLFINTEHHGVQLDGSDPQPLRIKVDAVR
ncbi:YbaY family lipoprotein [Pseudomonas auratipiscis]|uniref:YbaY family lipoprotein n=1 Tax=Pseudomonas auratipiscis TaxID=3115853 RepID=A0AB35WWN9_9PSED|nr:MULTISPECIES: YbaY family lipoprotein [unclassified Pseudomonas]MEE1867470.1 YbaY family lipoprotein [Pseudomonas sp. 120P]MEE1958297.1 YbaY family lipoprotein [Pseudomonas sp. 119P]